MCKSNFDEHDSLKREKAVRGRFSVRSDSLQRQNVQSLAGVYVSGSFTCVFSPCISTMCFPFVLVLCH